MKTKNNQVPKQNLSFAVKTLSKSIREYKKPSILAPIFVMMEVILECFIPYIMTLLLGAIEISSIKLNGTTISPNYRVGEGIHTLVVTDTLGNVENITIYCGALSKPTITIFNYYDGEYYEISSDSAYAYNSSTLEYLYVKVSGTNIQDISVNDGTDRLYDSDDVVFSYLTNADSLHEHGMKLADLITNANGRVTIRATGDGGEVSSIELNVDNQVPVIQIISGLGSSSVYLFDTAHSITLETGTRNYTLEEANYKYELNYEYLFKMGNT